LVNPQADRASLSDTMNWVSAALDGGDSDVVSSVAMSGTQPTDRERDTSAITPLIRTIRDQRAILDADLASLYGVPAFRCNEAFRRNRERFPEEFAFQLSWAALSTLLLGLQHPLFALSEGEKATSSPRPRGGRKFLWKYSRRA